MSGQTLLVVGDDRISRLALLRIEAPEDVIVYIDRSRSVGRVIRLVRRGSLSLPLLLKMTLCEWRRPKVTLRARYAGVSSNAELVRLIAAHAPQRIVLFRAGLIINQAVLSTGVPIMNVHCAKVPEYGGIGSVERALRDGAYDQVATLHQVTASIDKGEVHAVEPYRLSPTKAYCENEDCAYEAGIRLLRRILR